MGRRKPYTKKNPKPLTRYEKIMARNRKWKERRKKLRKQYGRNLCKNKI